jgi:hypothetical protein
VKASLRLGSEASIVCIGSITVFKPHVGGGGGGVLTSPFREAAHQSGEWVAINGLSPRWAAIASASRGKGRVLDKALGNQLSSANPKVKSRPCLANLQKSWHATYWFR